MSKSKTFCPLLFNHLATHPDGKVSHCCVSDHFIGDGFAKVDDKLVRLGTTPVSDIYNSDTFKAARLKMLNGERPKACLPCYKNEDRGVTTTKRQHSLETFNDFTFSKAQEITEVDGTISSTQFELVELRLGNTCNAACIMCNPISSSKWANDYKKLKDKVSFRLIDDVDMGPYKWWEDERFWDDLLSKCQKVKIFYINGGEPTLIKQHFKFLQRLIDIGKTDIKIWYNINLTTMNMDIINLWKQFKNVHVCCSIDDIEDRNYYIRYPTKWNDVLTNFDLLYKQRGDGLDISITNTLTFLNYMNAGHFWKYWADKYPDIIIRHNFVNSPAYMSANVLPEDLKEIAHSSFKECMPDQVSQNLVNRYTSTYNLKEWRRAIEYIRGLDAVRGLKFTDYFDEFQNINTMNK